MELLKRVVTQDDRVDAVGNLQDERVATADRPRGWRHDIACHHVLVEFRALAGGHTVFETRVGHHDYLDVGILRDEGPDRFIELSQAGRDPSLGGEVGPVHDHPRLGLAGAHPTARSSKSACSAVWTRPEPVAGLADSARATCDTWYPRC